MLNLHQHQNQSPSLSPQYEGENIKGVAVLSFPNVELERGKSHATLSTLNVFYFSHYQLFVLQLQDWKYALLPNIMVTACKRPDKQGYIYTVPAQDGFHHLKIGTQIPNTAIRNFETVLSRSTDFYYVMNGVKYKPSPRPVQRSPTSGNKQFFADENVMTTGDGLGFERKRDKFKRTLKNIADKFSRKTKVEESENLNMTQIRTFESIKGTTKAMAPVIRFHKNEIEETIINGNNIVRSMNPSLSPSKNSHLNQGISPRKRQPIIMLSEDPRDLDRIQLKTSPPPKDFKAAVNARADAIAQQIVNMHLNKNNPNINLLQPQPTPNYALLKKDLSVISEKSDEATLSEPGNGNGNTKDDKETHVSEINLSSRLLSRQSTPEDIAQLMHNVKPIPYETRDNGLKMSFSNGFPSNSIDEGYKNTNIECLPITIRHSEG